MRQSRHALDEQADVTAGAGRRVGQERRRSGLDPASGDILDLQASAGNGAIAKLLAGGPGATAGTKGAPLRLQRAVTSPPVVQREAGPPLLRVGSVGSEVVDLQAALNSAGVARPPLVTDGQFGGGTRSAVVALQRGAGIAPDGIVGPDTRAALAMHGGQGHGSAEEAELGRHISAAVHGQVGAAGTAAGAAGTAAGTPKGVSGELTTGPVSGSGSYDAGTGEASGAVSTRNGSASGSYNTDTGSGSGSVSTGSTTASGSYDAGTGEASGAVSTRNGSASGSYNTDTGSGSGSVSTGSTTASGGWDAGSHTASGQVTTASGTSASGTYNADSGTGAGSVHTSYGDAGVSVDDTTVHASVSVPGVGDVTVNVDRPDWL